MVIKNMFNQPGLVAKYRFQYVKFMAYFDNQKATLSGRHILKSKYLLFEEC